MFTSKWQLFIRTLKKQKEQLLYFLRILIVRGVLFHFYFQLKAVGVKDVGDIVIIKFIWLIYINFDFLFEI